MSINYANAMEIIGYQFHNIDLLKQAFLHSSCANERKIKSMESYERLEFLGDAILEMITSEFLYNNYAKKAEGELSKLRASIVCEYCLADCARTLHYGDFVSLSKGEQISGGADRDSILCDLFESVLGAIYLDGGIEPAKKYVYDFLLSDIEHKRLFYDAKTNLQEYVQKHNMGPVRYELYHTEGPQHAMQFFVQLYINDVPYSKAQGSNIKNAEQKAAYNTLIELKKSEK